MTKEPQPQRDEHGVPWCRRDCHRYKTTDCHGIEESFLCLPAIRDDYRAAFARKARDAMTTPPDPTAVEEKARAVEDAFIGSRVPSSGVSKPGSPPGGRPVTPGW